MADEHNPVAWAVVNPSGGTRFLGVTKDDARQEATASERVVPVYWPVLADAEREAVEWVIGQRRERESWVHAALRGLLERLGPKGSE